MAETQIDLSTQNQSSPSHKELPVEQCTTVHVTGEEESSSSVNAVNIVKTDIKIIQMPNEPSQPSADDVFKAPVPLRVTNADLKDTEVSNGSSDRQGLLYSAKLTDAKETPVLSYKEPPWSGLCSQEYKLEVIKNGVVLSSLNLSTKPYYTFGRLPQCDVAMEHPSLSRFHAILQYRAVPSQTNPIGWYLYDLGSTHGTCVNKQLIEPGVYHRVRVGFVVKFGGSTRLHVMQGPEEDQDVVLTASGIEELRRKQKELLELKKTRPTGETQLEGVADSGCSWGIEDDPAADADEDLTVNPFAVDAFTEELNLDDPKKTLRGWFEREGYDQPEYIIEELSHGRFKCRVDLPVDTPTGHPMVAEVTVQGKKKEAVVQCAMEACRMLDKQGILRQSNPEGRKRKAKNWEENDFYDSEEDEFLDRTGDIEKKRTDRMRRAGKLNAEPSTVTYEQLLEDFVNVETEMAEIHAKLDRSKQCEVRGPDIDDLDAYMLTIKAGGLNATEKMKLKKRQMELKHVKARVEKLIKVAKPNCVPDLKAIAEDIKRKAVLKETPQQLSPPADRLLEDTNEHSDNKTVESRDDQAQHKRGLLEAQHSEKVECPKNLPLSESSEQVFPVPLFNGNESDTSASLSVEETPQPTVEISETPSKRLASTAEGSHPVEPLKKKRAAAKSSSKGLSNVVQYLKSQAEITSNLEADPDYASWLPPTDQSGDGKTKLNEKYGY